MRLTTDLLRTTVSYQMIMEIRFVHKQISQGYQSLEEFCIVN